MKFRVAINHLVLLSGVFIMVAPIVLIFLSSTQSTAALRTEGMQFRFGALLIENYQSILNYKGGFAEEVTPIAMLKNSMIVATGVALITTALSFFTAYSVVYFRFRLASAFFWLVLITLLFPLESRFIPTFQVTASLGLINTHIGIVLPALAAALGTFFFRQFFLSLPDELLEAAQLDGAGPLRFCRDILLPLSWSRAGAIFVVAFMIGWNQYLWPLMISTDDTLYTLVRGARLLGQESGPGMAFIIITIIPPFILLLIFQKWFFSALNVEDK